MSNENNNNSSSNYNNTNNNFSGRGSGGRNNPRGRGNGGRGNAGRSSTYNNSNNRNSNNKNNSGNRNTNNNYNKEKGETEEIKHYILDCSNRKAMENNKEHLDKIEVFIGSSFGKYADQIKHVFQYREDPDLDEPKEISEEDAQHKIKYLKYQEKYKRYLDREEGVVAAKKKLYNILWGQCTKLMQGEIKACSGFHKVKKKQDPIKLLNFLDAVSHSFRDHQYTPGNV